MLRKSFFLFVVFLLLNEISYSDGNLFTTITMTELDTSARTTYPLQSNACIHYICQEPANPNKIHAIFMTSKIPNTWDDRNTRYFFSSNGGTTWSHFAPVGATRSGFPFLSITPDGRAMITMHNTDEGGIQRGQLYMESGSGTGTFIRTDPGLSNPSFGNIWMVCAGTNSKSFVVAAQNGLNDSLLYNIYTGIWGGWRQINPPSPPATAQSYSVAIGTGKWGIVFNTLNNGAAYIESTNEGVTWGTPVTIWTWRSSDSTGTMRSIDLIYEGPNPRVLLGLGHVDPSGGYNPRTSSSEVLWAPDINGGIPVTVDQAPGLNGHTSSDVFFSCCRGTIGKSNDGSLLFAAYNKARTDTSVVGENFYDAYLKYSTNHGLSWSQALQLTNLIGQGTLADYRFVSISPNNAPGEINIVCGKDSVAGSNAGNPSIMKEMYIKAVGVGPGGIHNIGSEIPKMYALQQNYPNPFNPSTKIRFELPKNGFVSIKLYDVNGKEAAVIVNENLSEGVKEADFNATNIASGIYFYTIRAGNFSQTKKMVVLK